MLSSHEFSQDIIIHNINYISKLIKSVNPNIIIDDLNEKGLCNGLSLAYAFYSNLNKREEFLSVLLFISLLDPKVTAYISFIVQSFSEDPDLQVDCPSYSTGKIISLPFQEIINIMQQIGLWQNQQISVKQIDAKIDKVRVLGSIGMNLIQKINSFPEGMSLVMLHTKNDDTNNDHVFCIERKGQDFYLFEPNRIAACAQFPLSELEAGTFIIQEIIKNFDINETGIVLVNFSFDENKEIDTVLSLLEKEMAYKEFFKQHHLGNISRRDVAYELLQYDITSLNTEELISINPLRDKLQQCIESDLKIFEQDFQDILPTLQSNQIPSPLYLAAKYGQIDLAQKLLKNKINVNEPTNRGLTALYDAAQNGNLTLVKIFLENGANVNLATVKGFTPLYMAIYYNHLEIVKLLLEHEVNIKQKIINTDETFLHLAVSKKNIEIVKLLLKEKINIDELNKEQKSALFIASENGYFKIAKLLIEEKANVNQADINMITPLYIATSNKYFSIIELLLENGADVNQAFNGFTPLHVAAEAGDFDVVKMLISKQANINYTGCGFAAMHSAIANDHLEIVKILIENQADINQCAAGFLPLQIAMKNKNLEIILLLLKNGAVIYDEFENDMNNLYQHLIQQQRIPQYQSFFLFNNNQPISSDEENNQPSLINRLNN